MNNLTEIVRKNLEKTKGFISSNNYQVLKISENYCEMEGILTNTSLNNLNIAHGGFIFGLADTAAGIAAMTSGDKVVTVDANINYFKPANGTKIIAKASPIKIGKTILVFEVLINNEKGELLAKSTITYFKI